MLPTLLAAGDRVVAPDLIGFGKSDKPKKDAVHQFEWHRQVLLELIERLDLRHVVLVVQDWGGILGLTLPMAQPDRYEGLLVMNTLLATGDAPLPAGFVDWRAMCREKPLYGVGRLLLRGNPHLARIGGEGERQDREQSEDGEHGPEPACGRHRSQFASRARTISL